MSTTIAPPKGSPAGAPAPASDRYKWIALSNTTIGMLITTINSSIVLIALPDIFRGIRLDPLLPGDTSYLLWMMMGFMVATAVLVVTFGRIGDIFGRVKMFFPHLIAQPFANGLHVAFDFAVVACLIAATASWMRGSRYVLDVRAA